MIHIAICDDDIQLCNQREDYIRKWRKEGRKLEAEVFNTGKEFEKALKERYFDLIFLDIIMKDCSGIELGRFIREELNNDSSMIVYMSGYGDEYALELFQFQPFHFLKKPFKIEEFKAIFCKACEKIQGDTRIFEFKSNRTVYRVPLKDIHYFEGDNRRVKIVTGTHTYHCYSTIENLFSKIDMEQAGFIRLHKSYAVNLRYVAKFSVRMVTLFDGEEFTISAPFKENAQRQYEIYSEKISRTK